MTGIIDCQQINSFLPMGVLQKTYWLNLHWGLGKDEQLYVNENMGCNYESMPNIQLWF